LSFLMRARLMSIQARALPHGPLDAVRQIALFALAYYAYRLVRGQVDDPTGAAVAFANARELIGIERALHVFVEPGVQTWALAQPVIVDVASWIYINAQTTVTLSALAFLYLAHNRNFYFVRNMFMVAMGIALVGYILFPTAPPRFFPEWGFVDSVSEFTGISHDSVAVNALFNPYAAVPSMHVAFALMVGVPLSRLSRRRVARVGWAIYPLLVTWVTVATANHFIADAVLGAATAAMAAWTAAWLARARPAAWAFTPSRAGATA
jgi:PAP2 superfamily protein